jgi:hypothetical protein
MGKVVKPQLQRCKQLGEKEPWSPGVDPKLVRRCTYHGYLAESFSYDDLITRKHPAQSSCSLCFQPALIILTFICNRPPPLGFCIMYQTLDTLCVWPVLCGLSFVFCGLSFFFFFGPALCVCWPVFLSFVACPFLWPFFLWPVLFFFVAGFLTPCSAIYGLCFAVSFITLHSSYYRLIMKICQVPIHRAA